MAGTPLKLAALLKDVADQPASSGTTPVSLAVLADASGSEERPLWQKHLRKITATVAGLLVFGGACALLAVVAPSSRPLRTAPEPQAQSVGPVKQAPVDAPAPQIDRSAFSKPVQELMQYVDNLRLGNVGFTPKFTGEEVAEQLGYSRLFASAYEEMSRRARQRESKQEQLSWKEIVDGFDVIAREEQTIDQLMARKQRQVTAIAYLRALQNGDVVFPGPQALAPTAPVVLAQLLAAYPATHLDVDDPMFAMIYRQAREFAMERVTRAGEVFAPEIIQKLRRLIIESSSTNTTNNATLTICENGASVGELKALTRICPHLHLSPSAMKLSEGVAQQQAGVYCQNKAAANLSLKLVAMPASELAEMCKRATARVQAGENEFLELAN